MTLNPTSVVHVKESCRMCGEAQNYAACDVETWPRLMITSPVSNFSESALA
jgi:hypothetical protein